MAPPPRRQSSRKWTGEVVYSAVEIQSKAKSKELRAKPNDEFGMLAELRAFQL